MDTSNLSGQVIESWRRLVKHDLYNSYLVRFWREVDAGWRGEVESIQTGQKWQFNNLEAMAQFLNTEARELTRLAEDASGEGSSESES